MNGEKEEEKKTRPTGSDGDVGCFFEGRGAGEERMGGMLRGAGEGTGGRRTDRNV